MGTPFWKMHGHVSVLAKSGDCLIVDSKINGNTVPDVILTAPTEFVLSGECEL
jgi:hypothetical protein